MPEERGSSFILDFIVAQVLPPQSQRQVHHQGRLATIGPDTSSVLGDHQGMCHRHQVTSLQRCAQAFLLTQKGQFLQAPLGVQKDAHLETARNVNSLPGTLYALFQSIQQPRGMGSLRPHL